MPDVTFRVKCGEDYSKDFFEVEPDKACEDLCWVDQGDHKTEKECIASCTPQAKDDKFISLKSGGCSIEKVKNDAPQSDTKKSSDSSKDAKTTDDTSTSFTFKGGIEGTVGSNAGDATYSLGVQLTPGIKFDKWSLSLDTVTIPISQDPSAIGGEMGIFSVDIDKTYPDAVGIFYKGALTATIPIAQKELPKKFNDLKKQVEDLYTILTKKNDDKKYVHSESERKKAFEDLQKVWPDFREEVIHASAVIELGDKYSGTKDYNTAYTKYKKEFEDANPDGALIENTDTDDPFAVQVKTALKEYDFMFDKKNGLMTELTGPVDKSNEDSYLKFTIGQLKGAFKNDLADHNYDGGFTPIQLGTHGLHAVAEYKQRYEEWIALKLKGEVAFKTGAVFLYGSTDKQNPHYSKQKGAYMGFDARVDLKIAEWLNLGVYALYQEGLSGKLAETDKVLLGGISPVLTFGSFTLNPELWLQNNMSYFVGAAATYKFNDKWSLSAFAGYANYPGETKTVKGNTESSGNCKQVGDDVYCEEDTVPSAENIAPTDISSKQIKSISSIGASVSYMLLESLKLVVTVSDEKLSEHENYGESNMSDDLRLNAGVAWEF